jgi:hypothetical protein
MTDNDNERKLLFDCVYLVACHQTTNKYKQFITERNKNKKSKTNGEI